MRKPGVSAPRREGDCGEKRENISEPKYAYEGINRSLDMHLKVSKGQRPLKTVVGLGTEEKHESFVYKYRAKALWDRRGHVDLMSKRMGDMGPGYHTH